MIIYATNFLEILTNIHKDSYTLAEIMRALEQARPLPAHEVSNFTNRHMILDSLIAQYERKNADYGNSASDTFRRFGVVAYFVRISDKLNRYFTLTASDKKAEVKDESVKDTLGDLITYCGMLLVDVLAPIGAWPSDVPNMLKLCSSSLSTATLEQGKCMFDKLSVDAHPMEILDVMVALINGAFNAMNNMDMENDE